MAFWLSTQNAPPTAQARRARVRSLKTFWRAVEGMIERETTVIVIGRVAGWAVGHGWPPLIFYKGALADDNAQ